MTQVARPSSVSSDVLQSDALRSFGVFAEHLNFTRAAEILHISQPSLHTKIGKLSASLGVVLYERAGRGLVLTDDGVRLAEFAANAGRSADDFVHTLTRPQRRLTLASGRGALLWVISDAVRRTVAAGVDVDIRPANRTLALDLLAGGHADLAAIAADPPPRHLRRRRVARVAQTLMVPPDHRLARRRRVRVGDLAGLELVVPPQSRPQRRVLDRAFADAGADWSVAAEADGWDLLVHLASLGVGATIVNGCVQAPASLVSVPITDLPPVDYWLAWRRERSAPARLLLDRLDADA